jgi:hypothetical protein
MYRCVALAFVLLAACNRERPAARAAYVPLKELEAIYGELVAVANHPTPDQYGTGERIGLFRDPTGTIWGLPLLEGNGGLRGCSPAGLHDAKVTGFVAAGSTIVGAMNQPTGWRGGTGEIELVYRDSQGAIHTQIVEGTFVPGSECWTPAEPGPSQQLMYYRLAPQSSQ